VQKSWQWGYGKVSKTDADEEMMDEENPLDVNDLQYELHHAN